MRMTRSELWLAAAAALLLLVACGGPALAWPAHHDFADAHTWLGLPHAGDVLSNLAFALAGVAGLFVLARVPHGTLHPMERATSALFFAGLVLTAAGSAWYHWAPDDARLVVDRTGMAIAFAGAIGLATVGRVSGRAAASVALALLVAGPVAARVALSGNVLPWAAVQFGGMGVLLALALAPRGRHATIDVRWGWMLAAYVVAKVLESHDEAVLLALHGWVSGHSLKHVAAAAAALPVIAAIDAARRSRQNARTTTGPRAATGSAA